MRLWSLHPRYLDAQGLVALWREALLAKAVLGGHTRGYRHHPQLIRFLAHRTPRLAINAYLHCIHEEASSRGYSFDRSKVGPVRQVARIGLPAGQLQHEWQHLLHKLASRSPQTHARWRRTTRPRHHPLFRQRPGGMAPWEKSPRH
jgi:hypothetical protein